MNYEDWEEALKLVGYFVIFIFLLYHLVDWIGR